MAQIAEWDDNQKRRLNVKPGLTGLAQINGRATLTREQKLDLDVQYVDNRGFCRDVRILLATFGLILRRRSVYEDKYSENEYTRGQSKTAEQ